MDFDIINNLNDKEITDLYSDTLEGGILTSYCICGMTQAKINSLPASSRSCGWGHFYALADNCMVSWEPIGAECQYLCARIGLTCYPNDCRGNYGYWTDHAAYGWCQDEMNGICRKN